MKGIVISFGSVFVLSMMAIFFVHGGSQECPPLQEYLDKSQYYEGIVEYATITPIEYYGMPDYEITVKLDNGMLLKGKGLTNIKPIEKGERYYFYVFNAEDTRPSLSFGIVMKIILTWGKIGEAPFDPFDRSNS